jgi:hypothetical protein
MTTYSSEAELPPVATTLIRSASASAPRVGDGGSRERVSSVIQRAPARRVLRLFMRFSIAG